MKRIHMRFFQTVLVATVACACILSAGSIVPLGASKLNYDVGGKSVPAWSGGALLVVEANQSSSPVIRMFNKAGQTMDNLPVLIPTATVVSVYGVSHSSNGATGACGYAIDKTGRGAAFYLLFPANEASSPLLVRTGTYHPYQIALATDGTVWTAGIEALDRPAAGDSRAPDVAVFSPFIKSGILRHFDTSGQMIASFIEQGTVAGGMTALLNSLGVPNSFSWSDKRVSWYSDSESRYIEIASDRVQWDSSGITLPSSAGAEQLDRHFVSGFTTTDNGDVFISVGYGGSGLARTNSLCRLDKARKIWIPVSNQKLFIGLFGSEGNTLVMSDTGDRTVIKYIAVSD